MSQASSLTSVASAGSRGMAEVTSTGNVGDSDSFEPEPEPVYAEMELANFRRTRGITLTPDQLKASMEAGSKVPKWKTLLKEAYPKERKTRISFRGVRPSMSTGTRPGFRTSIRPRQSHSAGTSVGEESERSSGDVKRSEEITSELDVSRRTDLDEESMETWWVRQATSAHRRIVFFLVVLFFCIFSHLGMAVWWLFEREIYPNPYLCNSEVCTVVAQNLLSRMNESVDPCEDFHLFVCGGEWTRSKLVQERRRDQTDDDWPLVTDQIHYDYSRSTTIGKILLNKDPVVLPFHQACMDFILRNNSKLNILFDIFEVFGLNIVKCDGVGCNLVHTLVSLFERDILWKHPFKISVDLERRTYEVKRTRDSARHSVLRYGYQAAISVIKNTLTYLSEMGKSSPKYHMDWGDERKIDAYAKLFLCADLNLFPYIQQGESGPVVWARYKVEELGKLCEFNKLSMKNVKDPKSGKTSLKKTFLWKNFLMDPAIFELIEPNPSPDVGIPAFDYDGYVAEIVGDFDPEPFTLQQPSPDGPEAEGVLLDGIFSNYELTVRFLQWRFIREYGFTLDQKMDRILWPVTRNALECDWISTCLYVMYLHMPFRGTTLYMTEILITDKSVIPNAKKLMEESVYPIIDEMNAKFTFPKFATDASLELQRNYAKRAFTSAEVIWPQYVRPIDTKKFDVSSNLVRPHLFLSRLHFWNIVHLKVLGSGTKMGVLRKFDNDLFWNNKRWTLEGKIHRPNIGRCDEVRKKVPIRMPLGSYEPPYFGTGFPALDLGGTGRYAIENLVQYVFNEGMSTAIATTFESNKFRAACDDPLRAQEQEIIDKIRTYHRMMRNDSAQVFASQTQLPDLWALPEGKEAFNKLGMDVNDIYSHQLARQLAMKITYEVHERMIRDNPTTGKLVLPGLTKYNARQLLFIQAASRNCEIYSTNKFKHKVKFGPLPQPISINLMAANSKEFGKVFRCKKGARMNPEDTKRYNYYE